MYIASVREVGKIRLIGGRPALDFANSIYDWHSPMREDFIATPERYIAWCRRTKLLTTAEARRIDADHNFPSLLRDLRKFREALYSVFVATIENRRAPDTVVQVLDSWIHNAWRGQTVDVSASQALRWKPASIDNRLPLRKIALSALDVLQNAAPRQLKKCATHGACGWLFLDESKNNSRQWCSMQTCGSVNKMRRYRRRLSTQE